MLFWSTYYEQMTTPGSDSNFKFLYELWCILSSLPEEDKHIRSKLSIDLSLSRVKITSKQLKMKKNEELNNKCEENGVTLRKTSVSFTPMQLLGPLPKEHRKCSWPLFLHIHKHLHDYTQMQNVCKKIRDAEIKILTKLQGLEEKKQHQFHF